MDGIGGYLNRLSDQDWNWWPCLFLRPAPDERMTTALVAQITCIYGPIAGLVASGVVIGWFSLNFGVPGSRDIAWAALALTGIVMVTFFVLYRSTVAVAWNRRAHRLQEELADAMREAHGELYGQWVPRGPLRRTDDV